MFYERRTRAYLWFHVVIRLECASRFSLGNRSHLAALSRALPSA
jgi:hypothetical protein